MNEVQSNSTTLVHRPKVSIIVPAYNSGVYIQNAIRSVLNQSINDLELIVVNDGSTDQTTEIVKGIDDPRLKLILQDNQGQSAAINKGVEFAKGNYIKLLDADDWLNPVHIESQLAALDGESDMVAACKWGYFVNDFTRPIVREEFTNKNYDKPIEWLVDSLTRDEGMMGGWKWLIPKSLWDKAGGFNSHLSLNNDFQFSIKLLLESGGVKFADDAVYSYRKGVPGALSSSSGRTAMESALLTTDLGTRLLLKRENSPRIRRICADRFQYWLYQVYPAFPELAIEIEQRITQLGGSTLRIKGGLVLRALTPLLGWKNVRKLQTFFYQYGYQKILHKKAEFRLRNID